MCARDQSSIFSIGGKFCPDYRLLLELHALTLVAHSYALLHCDNDYYPLILHVKCSPEGCWMCDKGSVQQVHIGTCNKQFSLLMLK